MSAIHRCALLLFCVLYTLGLFWWPKATAGGFFTASTAGALWDSRRRGLGWAESLLRSALLSLCAAALPPLLPFAALHFLFHRCRRQHVAQV